MDEHRFDQLSRRLARFQTRRQAVKAFAGAVVTTIVWIRGTAAQGCTAHHSACGDDRECYAGAVCESSICMPGCRIEGSFYGPWSMPAGDICQVCAPETSTTSWSAANEGMSCWSGDPNAGVTTCRNGVCTGQAQQRCSPPTPCHLEGEVDPVTGLCVNPPAPAGTPCGIDAMCHGGFYAPADMCDGSGFCIGGGSRTRACAPYVCDQDTCTTSCQTDADCAPGAHCDDGSCYPDEDLGAPCDEDSDCQSGICVNGVCCNQRCEGLCETCSAGTGGFCSPVVCDDDGLSCTTGRCDEATGACTHTLNPNACLIDDVCFTDRTVNPANACERCDSTADSDAWSAVVCDDGLSCTTDSCDPATGCVHTLNTGFCLIGEVCYADGDPNPVNACEACDAGGAPEGWAARVCDDGLSCTADSCDTATGDCVFTLRSGFCLIDAVCHADAAINPANGCEACNAAADPAGWSAVVCPDDGLNCTANTCNAAVGSCLSSIDIGSCLIGGACYTAGETAPQNACLVCDPVVDQTGWSAVVCDTGNPCVVDSCLPSLGCVREMKLAGTSCDDGNRCDGHDTCDGAGHCVVGTPTVCQPPDQCHAAGVCDPDSGGCSYANLPDGTPCNAVNTCSGHGACQGGICVGTDPENDPSNCGRCGYSCEPGDSCVNKQCCGFTSAGEICCPMGSSPSTCQVACGVYQCNCRWIYVDGNDFPIQVCDWCTNYCGQPCCE